MGSPGDIIPTNYIWADRLHVAHFELRPEVTLMITSAFPLLFVVAAILVFGATGNLLTWSPFVIGVQVVAVSLSAWARHSFQKGAFRVTAAPAGTTLIRRGPYRIVRHPMYSAALLFVWAAVVGHPLAWTLAIGVAVTGVVVARVVAEDRLLRGQFAEYDDYTRSTKALLPYVF
jgi:protein-S-isoprenylcysteine O-methyltransferase Ste14